MNREIVVEKKEHIGWIILNRPESYNTFNVPFAKQLNNSLLAFEEDENIRVIVIKASGKHFSAGIDVGELKSKKPDEYRGFLKLMDLHNHTIARMEKPVIASVKGYALANGAGLTFACDMTVAAKSAVFGTTAINVGLICLGPAVPLMRLVGRKKTLEMVLTGDTISAYEAEKLGLVNNVVEDDNLDEVTLELAMKLAAKSPLALRAGKRGIYALNDISYHESVDYMTELFTSLCITEDAEEGINAFMEKRNPIYKGR